MNNYRGRTYDMKIKVNARDEEVFLWDYSRHRMACAFVSSWYNCKTIKKAEDQLGYKITNNHSSSSVSDHSDTELYWRPTLPVKIRYLGPNWERLWWDICELWWDGIIFWPEWAQVNSREFACWLTELGYTSLVADDHVDWDKDAVATTMPAIVTTSTVDIDTTTTTTTTAIVTGTTTTTTTTNDTIDPNTTQQTGIQL